MTFLRFVRFLQFFFQERLFVCDYFLFPERFSQGGKVKWTPFFWFFYKRNTWLLGLYYYIYKLFSLFGVFFFLFRVLRFFLTLFISSIILFQLIFIFNYRTFSNKDQFSMCVETTIFSFFENMCE